MIRKTHEGASCPFGTEGLRSQCVDSNAHAHATLEGEWTVNCTVQKTDSLYGIPYDRLTGQQLKLNASLRTLLSILRENADDAPAYSAWAAHELCADMTIRQS